MNKGNYPSHEKMSKVLLLLKELGRKMKLSPEQFIIDCTVDGEKEVSQMNEYSQEITNRLKRVEGQVRGVIRMMEENKDCKEVVTQLSAIRSAVDRAIGVIVAKNLESCIREAHGEGKDAEEAIQEAVSMIVRTR